MVERFPETVETQPELLAHHYTEAGLAAQAVPYWQRAGQRAMERSANIEAISHLTKGLEVLKTLPETPERHQQELTLQLALGAALSMLKGYTAPETEQAYSSGATALPAGGRQSATLRGVGRAAAVLSQPNGAQDGTGTWGNSS